MTVADIISVLESKAPKSLQESYDNAGLLTGNAGQACTGVLCCLDVTEQVLDEAVNMGCNLVVAHHPVIFRGLKSLTGSGYVERVVIRAIKNDIAIYASHTNLDNVSGGVNSQIAVRLGLQETSILSPKSSILLKLITFVPVDYLEIIRNALFRAGAGDVGNYSECSFTSLGEGSFLAGTDTSPFVGEQGIRHYESEQRLEVILPEYLKRQVVGALNATHPYEEPAFDLLKLENEHQLVGSGLVGSFPEPMQPAAFLEQLRAVFQVPVVRHTQLPKRQIQKVAVCGGAGSFLIGRALQTGADAFVTADMKYHEFFDADDRLLICDVGHFESEQYTIELLHDLLLQKFPNFAVLKTTTKTNPVHYFVG